VDARSDPSGRGQAIAAHSRVALLSGLRQRDFRSDPQRTDRVDERGKLVGQRRLAGSRQPGKCG
jgi:hypothetical protein